MIRSTLKKVIRWASSDTTKHVKLTDSDGPVATSTVGAEGMNFSLYRADGGYVIEYRAYDSIKDRRINSLHLITKDENLGERIGQIITLELLRN